MTFIDIGINFLGNSREFLVNFSPRVTSNDLGTILAILKFTPYAKMLDNDLRPLITKKSLGKLESFGHKLIKNNHTVFFYI